jgi:hypothetical protein
MGTTGANILATAGFTTRSRSRAYRPAPFRRAEAVSAATASPGHPTQDGRFLDRLLLFLRPNSDSQRVHAGPRMPDYRTAS